MKQLLRYRKNLRFVFFDFETESLTLNFGEEDSIIGNRPWEIGLLKADSEKEIDSYQSYVKWRKPIKVTKEAARITGFDKEKYKQFAVDEKEVFKIMLDWFDWADYIVGHNILAFDIPLAREWHKTHNKEWKYMLNKVIDTKCLAQAIECKIPFDIEKDDFLAWQIALSSYHVRGVKTNLSFTAKKYGIEIDDSKMHRADEDILVNYEVFKKQLWNISI